MAGATGEGGAEITALLCDIARDQQGDTQLMSERLGALKGKWRLFNTSTNRNLPILTHQPIIPGLGKGELEAILAPALRDSVLYGRARCVRLLLQAKADVHAKIDNSRSLLEHAKEHEAATCGSVHEVWLSFALK